MGVNFLAMMNLPLSCFWVLRMESVNIEIYKLYSDKNICIKSIICWYFLALSMHHPLRSIDKTFVVLIKPRFWFLIILRAHEFFLFDFVFIDWPTLKKILWGLQLHLHAINLELYCGLVGESFLHAHYVDLSQLLLSKRVGRCIPMKLMRVGKRKAIYLPLA